MKARFWLKLALFILPVALYVGPPFYISELMPLGQVALLQAGATPVLYGPTRDNFFAYKLASVQVRETEVLVLGSSRVMQFRSMFFNRHSAAFYNAGGAAQSVREARGFLERLYGLDGAGVAPPRVLIIGLDHLWLMGRETPPYRIQRQIDEERALTLERVLRAGKRMFQDWMEGRFRMGAMLSRREPVHGVRGIGLSALAGGGGFRNDGSYQYSHVLLHPGSADERLAEGFQRLRDNQGHFSGAPRITGGSLTAIETLLQDCHNRGVFVIGFSPPFAPSIYVAMIAGGEHPYLLEMEPRLQELFERYGFAYFDFSNPAPLGATDDDMIDGFHGSEYVNLLMYMHMLERLPEVLEPYSDRAFLWDAAQQSDPVNRFELFGNQF